MDPAAVDVDELVEFWTLLKIDREQFDRQARHYSAEFRVAAQALQPARPFPRGPSDLHDGVIDFVARQVGVDGSEFGSYEWAGSTT